jgi:hypothetical protein
MLNPERRPRAIALLGREPRVLHGTAWAMAQQLALQGAWPCREPGPAGSLSLREPAAACPFDWGREGQQERGTGAGTGRLPTARRGGCGGGGCCGGGGGALEVVDAGTLHLPLLEPCGRISMRRSTGMGRAAGFAGAGARCSLGCSGLGAWVLGGSVGRWGGANSQGAQKDLSGVGARKGMGA